MKKFFIAAIFLAVTSIGFAQITPTQTATAIFDRVLAVNLNDCSEVQFVLNEDLSEFDYVYCGVIGDTYTSVNQRWTVGVYENYGYRQVERWISTRFGPSYHPLTGWMSMFAGPNFNSVAALALIRHGRQEATIIVLAFNYN